MTQQGSELPKPPVLINEASSMPLDAQQKHTARLEAWNTWNTTSSLPQVHAINERPQLHGFAATGRVAQQRHNATCDKAARAKCYASCGQLHDKGKGSTTNIGDGCSICGSRFHSAGDCLVHNRQQQHRAEEIHYGSKGKGKGKGLGKSGKVSAIPKGKGKGKAHNSADWDSDNWSEWDSDWYGTVSDYDYDSDSWYGDYFGDDNTHYDEEGYCYDCETGYCYDDGRFYDALGNVSEELVEIYYCGLGKGAKGRTRGTSVASDVCTICG